MCSSSSTGLSFNTFINTNECYWVARIYHWNSVHYANLVSYFFQSGRVDCSIKKIFWFNWIWELMDHSVRLSWEKLQFIQNRYLSGVLSGSISPYYFLKPIDTGISIKFDYFFLLFVRIWKKIWKNNPRISFLEETDYET